VKPIFKLFYRIYRMVSAVWYWMRRRFTLPGLCVAGGFLVVAGVGTDIENTVTYQTFALLLALPGNFFRDARSASFGHRWPAAPLPGVDNKSVQAAPAKSNVARRS